MLCSYFKYVHSVFSVFITLDANYLLLIYVKFIHVHVKLEIPRANTGGVLDYVFTLELSNFELHIILYIALKLYKIEWLISPEWGHLNSYLARGGGIWTLIFQKFKCPGGGMLKFRFDWYIIVWHPTSARDDGGCKRRWWMLGIETGISHFRRSSLSLGCKRHRPLTSRVRAVFNSAS